ncbi:hypothetical protein ILYODFUR_030110 [Ilyodon furcidens]|uniref:Uncharacterized protein n=1 Tax=Ilyodon furcidens TaxID=33524 RepID=A0ABV0VIJ7_9TELE
MFGNKVSFEVCWLHRLITNHFSTHNTVVWVHLLYLARKIQALYRLGHIFLLLCIVSCELVPQVPRCCCRWHLRGIQSLSRFSALFVDETTSDLFKMLPV